MEIQQKINCTTELEDWVTRFYKRLGILHPTQININEIASLFGIYIKRKERPSFHYVNGRYTEITIDVRKELDMQKEMFFHELCHVLRHYGNQLTMPKTFIELQEWDAKNFTRYAAIPHHMVKYIDLDSPYVIDQMVSLFKVTAELCEERLEQIKNRTRYNIYVAESEHTYEV
jgi:hypothetical protein